MRWLLCLMLAAGGAFAQYPAEKEKALGRELAAQIERQSRPLSDRDVITYIDALVKKLSPEPVTVSPIDSADMVVAPLPGRMLVLSSGAIRCTASEAELAALLAHAIGHMQTRVERAGDFRVPIVFLGGWAGLCMRVGEGLVPAGFAARVEPQADAFALERLASAGYDVQALGDVFRRCSSRYPPQVVAASSPVDAVVNTSEFERIRARLTPPAAPRRPAPSLRHPDQF